MLFVLLLCLTLEIASSSELAEKKHFGNSVPIPVYLPANYLNSSLDVMESAYVRKYHIEKPTKFRVIWNPSRCAQTIAQPFGIILTFLKDWTPQFSPNIYDLLEHSVSFSSPQIEKYPINVPWERKYRVHVSSYVDGIEIYKNEYLEMTMTDGGFFVEIFPSYREKNKTVVGKVILSYYDWKSGKKRDETVIPLKNNAQYLSIFSRIQTECPAFISHVDRNFKMPYWNRYPENKGNSKKIKMSKHNERMQDELTLISLHLAVAFALISAVFFTGKVALPYLAKQQSINTAGTAERVLDLIMGNEFEDPKKSEERSLRKKNLKSKGSRNSSDATKTKNETAKDVSFKVNWLDSLDKTQTTATGSKVQ